MTTSRLFVTCVSLALQVRAQATSYRSSVLDVDLEGACADRDNRKGGLQQQSFEFMQLHANKLKTRPPPVIDISVKTVAGGDWTSVECDLGWKAISGGCSADGQSPYRFQMDGPKGERGWECGGHGGKKEVWVLCARGMDVVIKEESGGDWTEVQCDAGRTVISGGCNAFAHPFKMGYNGLVGNDTWKCGGHGGSKKVWAICALGMNVSMVEKKGGDWVEATCAPGQKLLGGGCNVYDGHAEFAKSGPPDFNADYFNTWKCGGFGGKKIVQATCWEPPAPRPCLSFSSAETCPTARCTVVEGSCKDFDVFMLANNTDVSVTKKTYKDITRDSQGCANLCGGESEAFVWSRTSGACWCAELTSDYSGWIGSDDTAYYRVGNGIFGGKACRLDKNDGTVDGKGSVKVIAGVTFADCLSRCKAESNTCTGIEYGHLIKRCELWRKPIGNVYERYGFECVNLARPPVCSAPDASQFSKKYPCSCGLATCGDSSTFCHSLQDYCDTPPPSPAPTPSPTYSFNRYTSSFRLTGPFCYSAPVETVLDCVPKCAACGSKCFHVLPFDTEAAKKDYWYNGRGQCNCLPPTGKCEQTKYMSPPVIFFKF
eukprot:TRINITY_DN1911_c0_g2_i1.p1 TRINITY_DN1911_c0_g2~~TRINITY_DN1911_c0_g2_i1.p1  ORF type:complete len:599 (-),score=64.65 TRINITY_DN1911_c0_g2_i1:151-1947(-)